MAEAWPELARRRLLEARDPRGGWGYRPGAEPSSEPTALAGLALLATADPARAADDELRAAARAAASWLGARQRPDGAVSLSASLVEPGWATAHALLLWAAVGDVGQVGDAPKRALAWLLAQRGKTYPKDPANPLAHDATIPGWGFVAETHSWVEPTALALLALRRHGLAGHARAADALRLLRDRALPTGGWNYGNVSVFGTTLRAAPGHTGQALLALSGLEGREGLEPDGERARGAVGFLQRALPEVRTGVSVGWGVLGLRAWNASSASAAAWLSAAWERASRRPVAPASLALLLLAGAPRGVELLGGRAPRAPEASHGPG